MSTVVAAMLMLTLRIAPFFVFDAVDSVDAVQVVVHRVAYRILASLKGQALVSHILEGNDLPPDILL